MLKIDWETAVGTCLGAGKVKTVGVRTGETMVPVPGIPSSRIPAVSGGDLFFDNSQKLTPSRGDTAPVMGQQHTSVASKVRPARFGNGRDEG